MLIARLVNTVAPASLLNDVLTAIMLSSYFIELTPQKGVMLYQ